MHVLSCHHLGPPYTGCSLNIVFFPKNLQYFAPSPSPELGCHWLCRKIGKPIRVTVSLRSQIRWVALLHAGEGLHCNKLGKKHNDHPVAPQIMRLAIPRAFPFLVYNIRYLSSMLSLFSVYPEYFQSGLTWIWENWMEDDKYAGIVGVIVD